MHQEKISYWILVVSTFPGLTIFLLSIAFNFVGDSLSDSLDPELIEGEFHENKDERKTFCQLLDYSREEIETILETGLT
jgi:hypothetical protein